MIDMMPDVSGEKKYRNIKKIMINLLDFEDNRSIESVLHIEKNHYGVYAPPSLKQLSSLRYLLERTGYLEDIHPQELLGLSKVECKILLKKLNRIYINQRRKYYR